MDALRARIAALQLRMALAKAKGKGGFNAGQARWPAGTPLGGQWKGGHSVQGSGIAQRGAQGVGNFLSSLFGSTSSVPATMADPNWSPHATKGPPAHTIETKGSVKHPAKDDKGRDVYIHRPKESTPPGHWQGKDKTVTVTPGAKVPASLNGVAFTSFKEPKDWTKVSGQNAAVEEGLPPLEGHKWKHPSAGVIIMEPDGRVWLTSPTNGFGGYRNTFPKGTQEPGLSLQQTAIKEAWEETGLKVRITGVLGDFERTSSIARIYLAERVGGTPADQGWESQAMRLAPRSAMNSLLNMPVDREISASLWEEFDLTKAKPGYTPEQIKALADVLTRPVFKAKGAGGAKGSKQGAWVNQPRWPSGTPLGGQWKSYDAAGLPKPPAIGSASNQGWQVKANAAYEAVAKGNIDQAVLILKPLELKALQLGYSNGNYAKAPNSQAKWAQQTHQYVTDLVATHGKATTLSAKVDAATGPDNLSSFKKIGAKPGGSNPGAVYADKKGTKWLVKGANYPSDDRAKNEVLASKLMQAVGIGAPDMKLVDLGGQYGGGLGVAAKMEDMTGWSKSNAQHMAKAQSEFAVHAWLANYDAVGMPAGDNLAMKGGEVFNYDPGGALLYRAQGLPKALPGGMLAHSVGEWDGMRNKSINAAAASVYGSMTADQLKASAQKLQAIDNKTITALVAAYGPGDDKQKALLASALQARRDDILAKAGLGGKAAAGTAAQVAATIAEQGGIKGKTFDEKVANAQAALARSSVVLSGSKAWMSDTTKEAYDKAADLILGKATLDKTEQAMFIAMANKVSGMGPLGNDEAEALLGQLGAQLGSIKAHPANGLGQTVAAMSALLYGAANDFGPEVPEVLAPHITSMGPIGAAEASLGGATAAAATGAQKPASTGQQTASFTADLTNTSSGHNKFYKVTVVGNTVTRQWGKIGTAGQTMTETFPTPQQALIAGKALANGKLAKGYLGSKSTNPAALAGGAAAPAPAMGGIDGKLAGLNHALGVAAAEHGNSNTIVQSIKETIPMLQAAHAAGDTDKILGSIKAANSLATSPGMSQAQKDLLAATAAYGDALVTSMPKGGATAFEPAGPLAGQTQLDAIAILQAKTGEPFSGVKGDAEGFGAGSPIGLAAAKAIDAIKTGNQSKFNLAMADLAGAGGAYTAANDVAKAKAAVIAHQLNDWATGHGLQAQQGSAFADATAVLMATAGAAAAPGVMPKLIPGTLGPIPDLKGIVSSKYGFKGYQVSGGVYQGRAALLQGDMGKLQAAYDKLKGYRDALPIGSKSRAKVMAGMAHLVELATQKAGLKIEHGKFSLPGGAQPAGAAASLALQHPDAAEQAKVMLDRIGNVSLNGALGQETLKAVVALNTGNDKGLATSIGTMATQFGTPQAIQLAEKLTALAEAKGGFPMATGNAASVTSTGGSVPAVLQTGDWKNYTSMFENKLAAGQLDSAKDMVEGQIKFNEQFPNSDTAEGTKAFIEWGSAKLAEKGVTTSSTVIAPATLDVTAPTTSLAIPAAPPQPKFVAGVTKDTTGYYQGIADKMQAAYQKGDLAALQQAAEKPKGGPIWPVFKSGTKQGQPKTMNGQLLSNYFNTLNDQLTKAVKAKTAADLDQPVKVPGPGENIGNLPAMPNFARQKLAETNTNAGSHNKKVEAIAKLAEKGDVKGLLGLNYGTNTYGKKQAALANDALAAMGSPFKVDPGQKKNSHPALTGQSMSAAGVAKTAALDPKTLPPKLDFIANSNGTLPTSSGKGLSSSSYVNQSNQAAYDKLVELAKQGDVEGVKNATINIVNKETGAVTQTVKIDSGHQHVSQHIKNFQELLVQMMDEKLNPPKPLEIFEAKEAASTIKAAAAKFPPHKLGASAKKMPSSQTIGHYIAIGQISGAAKLKPSKTKPYDAAQVSQAQADYALWKHDHAAQAFRSAVQGHGGHDYHAGWDKDASPSHSVQSKGYSNTVADLVARAKAAHKWARKQPPGTMIHKWEDLSPDMKAKLEGATPGLVIMNPAPSCASKSATSTKGFGPSHRWNIIYTDGAKALNSFASGSHPGEQEVTLLPNHRFIILEHKPGTYGSFAETTVLMLPPDPALDSDGYTTGYGY